jgi:hypothetical protein
MKLGALSWILVFWEGQFWVLKINCNLPRSLGVMLICTILECYSMLFIFVVLTIGWVYGQNFWHWFVKENKKMCWFNWMLVITVDVSNRHIYTMCNSMMDLCEPMCILSEQYDIVIFWTIVCVQLPHFLVTTKQC